MITLKPLSIKFLQDFAKQYNIEFPLLLAIGKKESGLMHCKDGQLQKRFEPHIYKGFLRVKKGEIEKHPSLPSLSADWIKTHTDDELKNLSTSYGVYQIMGWHYKDLYYQTVGDMVEDWNNEEIHIKDFCLFCIRYYNGKFLEALQKKDFEKIALLYNGKYFRANKYDTDIKKFYLKFKEVLSKDEDDI